MCFDVPIVTTAEQNIVPDQRSNENMAQIKKWNKLNPQTVAKLLTHLS